MLLMRFLCALSTKVCLNLGFHVSFLWRLMLVGAQRWRQVIYGSVSCWCSDASSLFLSGHGFHGLRSWWSAVKAHHWAFPVTCFGYIALSLKLVYFSSLVNLFGSSDHCERFQFIILAIWICWVSLASCLVIHQI